MVAWETLADLGTAGGTVVLAAATFVAVQASVRSTKIAERALLTGQRPALVPTGPDDTAGRVQFADGQVFPVGAEPLVRAVPGIIYLAMGLVNDGAGAAVLRGYRLEGERDSTIEDDPRGAARHWRGDPAPAVASFRVQQRDLLVSTKRPGFWQAALRDESDPLFGEIGQAIETRGRITVDLLHGDIEGAQPAITRFVLLPESGSWRCDAVRYWGLSPSKDLRPFGFS